jgi:tRNA pseudouridine55 synthase
VKGGRADAKTVASGLIIVDKPSAWTSHDVVAKIRRLSGTKRVGHAGTLDPMATGVLVVGVEKATRLLGHLALTEKEYLATIRLGQVTDTGDAEGTITASAPAGTAASELPHEAIAAAAAALTGTIQQVPPAVSAIKVAGKRSYELARKGEAPVLPARPVTVWSFQVLAARPVTPQAASSAPAEPPQEESVRAESPASDELVSAIPRGGLLDVDVAVRCSSGTYVRALARDLGEALGVGGHLTMLRRTRVGPYDLGMARTLEQLASSLSVLPIEQAAAAAFGTWHLSEAEATAISHGRRLPASALRAAAPHCTAPGFTASRSTAPDSYAPPLSPRGSVALHPSAATTSAPCSAASPSSDPATAASSPSGQPAAEHDQGGGPVAAFAPDGTFIALVEERDGEVRPLAVFVP